MVFFWGYQHLYFMATAVATLGSTVDFHGDIGFLWQPNLFEDFTLSVGVLLTDRVTLLDL